jgi:penicillin-binding protein 2
VVRRVRIKDHWAEQRIFSIRSIVAGVLVAVSLLTVAGRLFYLQVLRHEYYAELSQGNRVRIDPIPPSRGLILDRRGVVLAENLPAFQLELVREQVGKEPAVDAALAQLVAIKLLEKEDVSSIKRSIMSHKIYESVPIRLQLNEDEMARFALHRHEFTGVDIRTRLTRHYPFGPVAVHAIGYVSAISESDLSRIDTAEYAGTTLIGKLGVEGSYEHDLHGKAGYRQVLVNAAGRPVERQGAFTPHLETHSSVAGKDLILGIDMRVQKAAEEGLTGKRGAVVAIDPRNGNVLALASTPAFDPNGFARGLSVSQFNQLQNDIDKPLLNRALRGAYPSGSTIKPAIALAGLTYHLVNPNKPQFCAGVFHLPGSRLQFREGKTGRHGYVDLEHAIAKSCDVYFYGLAATIGAQRIADFLSPFGYGSLTGIDIGGEKPGLLPSPEWKKKAFKRAADQVWFPGETVNFGVGQGYLLVTPLQLSHIATVLAARGKSFRPRLVASVRDPSGQLEKIQPAVNPPVQGVSDADWDLVLRGMIGATTYGTAAYTAGKNATYKIAGKTGTAQVFTVSRSVKLTDKVSERLKDHSWFIAYAPAESPQIAVAVLVENGGFGSAVAAPIARRVMDAWILNTDAAGTALAPAVHSPAAPSTTQTPGPKT